MIFSYEENSKQTHFGMKDKVQKLQLKTRSQSQLLPETTSEITRRLELDLSIVTETDLSFQLLAQVVQNLRPRCRQPRNTTACPSQEMNIQDTNLQPMFDQMCVRVCVFCGRADVTHISNSRQRPKWMDSRHFRTISPSVHGLPPVSRQQQQTQNTITNTP